jgi:hypothetical protein
MMVHFRKRFGVEALKQINEWIHEEQCHPSRKATPGPSLKVTPLAE